MKNRFLAINLALLLMLSSLFMLAPSAEARETDQIIDPGTSISESVPIGLQADTTTDSSIETTTGSSIEPAVSGVNEAPAENSTGASPVETELAVQSDEKDITVDGTQFDRTENNSGKGWDYNAGNNSLTLDNYKGSSIFVASGDLTVYCHGDVSVKGENGSWGSTALSVDGLLDLYVLDGTASFIGGTGFNESGGCGIYAAEADIYGGSDTVLNVTGGDGAKYGAQGLLGYTIYLWLNTATITGGDSESYAGCGIGFFDSLYIDYCELDIKAGNASCRAIDTYGDSPRFNLSPYIEQTKKDISWYHYTTVSFTTILSGCDGTINGVKYFKITNKFPLSIDLGDYIFTKSGYQQIGWMTTHDEFIPLTDMYTPTSNDKLIAEWVPVDDSTVLFNGLGGKIDGSYYKKTTTVSSVAIPERASTNYVITRSSGSDLIGYLVGWTDSSYTYYSQEGLVLCPESKWYTPGSIAAFDKKSVLYANWIFDTGNVISYHGNGGVTEAGSDVAEQANWGDPSNLSLNVLPGTTFTRQGYEFDGWKTSDGRSYSVGMTVPGDADKTTVLDLYAQWVYVGLKSISASFEQGQTTIYAGSSLDSLKSVLKVSGLYMDSSTEPLSATEYTLSGTLNAGISTITVTSEGKTTTFDVTVTKVKVQEPSVTGTYTYSGMEQTASIVASDKYTISGNKGTAAADYNATVTLIDPANNEWADGTNAVLTLPWTIAPATITGYVTSAPTASVLANSEFNTDAGALKNGAIILPSKVTVAFGTDQTESTDIVWSDAAEAYNAKGGVYTYQGTVSAGSNFNAYSTTLNATLTVTPVKLLSVTTVPVSLTVVKGTVNGASSLTDSAIGFPQKVSLGFDNSVPALQIDPTWNKTIEDLQVLAANVTDELDQETTVAFTGTNIPEWATVGITLPSVVVAITNKLVIPQSDITFLPMTVVYGDTVSPSAVVNEKTYGACTVGYTYKGAEATSYGPSEAAPQNAGNYTVTALVQNSIYNGTKTVSLTIAPKSVNANMIDAVGAQIYTGNAITPVLTVSDGALGLKSSVDFTAAYANNINVGTATVTITGIGNYTGTESITFKINPATSQGVVSGGGGGGGGGSTVTSGSTAATTENWGAGTLTKMTTNIVAKTDKTGNASANVTAAQMNDAISAIIKAAGSTSGSQSGLVSTAVQIKVKPDSAAESVNTTIPQDSFKSLTKNSVSFLTISSPLADITFDAAALKTIGDNVAADITVKMAAVDKNTLSEAAKTQVGDRPVYDLAVLSGGKTISDFGGGTVTVSIPYTPAANEDSNSIVIYYISNQGELVSIPNCIYDPASGTVSFKTSHFSTYAVGYNKMNFSDVSGWFADAVNVLAARGVVSGTGEGRFSPNESVTRAQFAMMLAKLSGDDLTGYTSSSFSDVDSSEWYSAAVQWAYAKGVVSGWNGKFSPDAKISRQEIASMLARYADKAAGYTLPTSIAKVTFSDSANISDYANQAVTAMQRAGIINGYSNGSFGPNAEATRAEASKMIAALLQDMME